MPDQQIPCCQKNRNQKKDSIKCRHHNPPILRTRRVISSNNIITQKPPQSFTLREGSISFIILMPAPSPSSMYSRGSRIESLLLWLCGFSIKRIKQRLPEQLLPVYLVTQYPDDIDRLSLLICKVKDTSYRFIGCPLGPCLTPPLANASYFPHCIFV